MPITQRGSSVNSFAFSKVWFRTRCIDLRVCDIKKINSACKSWLYQYTFAKPEESVLYRPHQHGGLGLHTVKFKSLAGFITTFLQTAANTTYIPNLLHSLLYRKHVLGEFVPEAPDPPPPYLNQDLFAIIRKVHDESPLNIVNMSEREWTRLLTEDFITMTVSESGHRNFIPCRVELASPSTDWNLSWVACRQSGIPPDLASFLWKMVHNLLSTQARLHHMGSTASPTCKMPTCSEDGTLLHELILCSRNDCIGHKLIHCLQLYVPGLQADAVLRLEHGNLEEELSLSATLLTAIILSYIWRERQAKANIHAYKSRADLEQYITLLRTTRLCALANKLEEMSNKMFQ